MKRTLFVALSVFSACGDNNSSSSSTLSNAEATPGCNPLVGDDCLTPFPSSFHEISDPTTATGVRVNLPADLMPQSNAGVAVRPDRMNQKDGFSPATQFLVYFAAGVDPTQLPTLDQIETTVAADSHVQLLDYATGERIPVFAEMDANTSGPGDRKALMIHPMKRLTPASRYIVALVGLNDASGKPLAPPGFRLLRDAGIGPGFTLDPTLATLQPRYEEIFARLATAGVARTSLTLAWDVITASDETATSHLVQMRDESLAMADSLTWTITQETDTPNDAHRMREVLATIQVPSYLTSDAKDATMSFGSDGKPKMRALSDVPIVIEIPKCAETATTPLPFVVFGHGLFGNALDTLRSNTILQYADEACAILVGTDWIGVSSSDLNTIASEVLVDLNHFPIVTDRLQQAHLNHQVMTRVFKRMLQEEPDLVYNGRSSDGATAYYFGVSNGGIQGGTFMALQEDITRGVLNVAGCDWSLMIFRSGQFNAMKMILNVIYKDALDRQLILTASQSEWDYSDPATFAPHWFTHTLPNSPPKKILVQESEGDDQVPNMATRYLVRTTGLVGLDLENHAYGIAEGTAPLDSAYTQWDIHPTPLPPITDTPAPNDNGAHGGIQTIPELQDQVRAFLAPDGQVISTCHGPCSF